MVARETVDILERGHYQAPSGRTVRIADELALSVGDTVLHTPAELDGLLAAARRTQGPEFQTRIEVTEETTLAAARRLGDPGEVPLALNFASAKNPGGGFLNGAHAQEEGLARSSGLYASLRAVPEFYAFHREQRDLLYSDHMIYSPNVPVFRHDSGRLLEEPYPVAFLTSAAPNRGAIRDEDKAERIPAALASRARKVLAAALAHGHRRLVLGAWGCGVFGNDPHEVAGVFAETLRPGAEFAGRFEHVVFAVWDTAKGSPRHAAFREVFADLAAA
ncbi:TIGR02452 family protein [Actinomadura sp. NBRC 104412]|uniref:TIGR02452 family protein n=1 Tax=Actinomadura sp. NBRC 104412 TaxID=3032203 RepID=UPI0024A0950E|nr:TIGR02452 family protein [Actinomadura sp. NBRC 104412]GLZ04533.1 TIGR02452 family protein [Actinomadura sp. NBRC 104412]